MTPDTEAMYTAINIVVSLALGTWIGGLIARLLLAAPPQIDQVREG
jgi:hypothetical protein